MKIFLVVCKVFGQLKIVPENHTRQYIRCNIYYGMKCYSYRQLNLVPEKICHFFIKRQENIPKRSSSGASPSQKQVDWGCFCGE